MPNKKKSRSQPSKKVAKAKIIRTPKKTGPGRPPKVFIAKPKAKQAGPGRPKKTIKTYMLPEKKNFRGFIVSNILHAPRKDNIILLLFVLSLLIFLFSIYVTILKSQNVLDEKMYLDESTVVNVQTGNIPFSQQEVSTGAATPTTQEVVDTKAVITAFYDAFNQKDIQTLYALTDSHLNKTNTFITYFTVNRISRFL